MQFLSEAETGSQTERNVNQQDGLKSNAHTHLCALIKVADRLVLSNLSAQGGF